MTRTPARPARPAGTRICTAYAGIIATTRAPARLLIRYSVPGVAVALPLLIVDPCPYPIADKFGNLHKHAHVHTLTDPRPAPWYKIAACCRRPYLVHVEAA